MSTSKTEHHTIIRTTENAFFGLADSAPVTKIYDRDTGASGTGCARTRAEADQRAWNAVKSENEARQRPSK